MNEESLISKIETLRYQLMQVACRHPLSSPEMQQISTCLDHLLNEYEQIRTSNSHR
ncbi:MAG: aspartyl-phosphate phosphatase Spo0E family protein [Sporolactobacillus sp.]|jgi:hypothetical protein|nr:aspartyl-phosphate phosphatase Spo0E family protein [Sporolactobacillus sp.]